jgi:V/A-type H+-transporting ATPase subunit I
MDKDREPSLKKLREVGVVHVEKKGVSSDTLARLLERKTKIENAIGILTPFEAKAKPSNENLQAEVAKSAVSRTIPHPYRRASDFVNSEGVPFSTEALEAPVRKDLVQHILDLGEERKFLQERAALFVREQIRTEGWGDFDPDDLRLLKEKGLALNLYELNLNAFQALPEDIPYFTASKTKTIVRVVVLGREIPGEIPFMLGEHSLKEINELLTEISEQIVGIDTQLHSLTRRKHVVQGELKNLVREIEFETASSGMGLFEDAPREFTVSWITGFVPVDGLGLLKRVAAENGWALISTDPGPDDQVPTKLKNNRLVRLLNPLTDFLEVIPGYYEADISGWFLLFFTIFFGMIFGDAAYGSIILIAALIGIFKNLKKGVPPIFKLILLLGASNFVWGVLTCTWFGVEAEKLPLILQKISLPLISNVTAARSSADDGIVRQNLMIFCFTLALLQLSIGHIIAITRCRTLKVLGDAGSIAMLAGMYGVVLILIASNEYRDLSNYIPMMPCVYALVGGFVLNFVFASYDGSIGRSIVESLKNFISMILGIANVFSDIMSYIRLWAVGLAGAAISSTVVAMAGPMLGHLMFFIFGVILLVFGHSLNLVLNALSVLVHGVRLNTLEFSGHVGLTWAGTPYKPFSAAGMPRQEMPLAKDAGGSH